MKASRALSLMFIGATIVATRALAADLHAIYLLALQNDAQYQAASAHYQAAKLNLPLARSAFKPALTAAGTRGKQRSDFTGNFILRDNNSASVNIEQRLFDRATYIGITQARLNVENAMLQFAIAHNSLTLRVANRYFNVLAARDSKEVARLQKIAIKRQMDLAAERLQVGLGTRTDLYDAQARFEQANADLIAADMSINNAYQELLEVIGTTPETIAAIAPHTPLKLPQPNQLEHWTRLARSNNLQVRSQDINLLVASHEISRQRAARIPTLSINANQRWQDGVASSSGGGSGGGSRKSSTASVGLNLNIPIYPGGSIKLRTKQAGLQFNATAQTLEATRRQATTATTAAFLAVTSGISQVQALAQAVRAGSSALEAKEEGFRAGLTTNLDVLDAQRDLSRSRTDYLRAKYNYFIAILQLEQAIGALDAEDILFINQWIEPE